MNTAYIFQEVYSGVQIAVYHVHTEQEAKIKFQSIVIEPDNWVYLGIKSIQQ